MGGERAALGRARKVSASKDLSTPYGRILLDLGEGGSVHGSVRTLPSSVTSGQEEQGLPSVTGESGIEARLTDMVSRMRERKRRKRKREREGMLGSVIPLYRYSTH